MIAQKKRVAQGMLRALAVVAAGLAAACVGGGVPSGLPEMAPQTAAGASSFDRSEPAPLPPAAGEIVGNGKTRVALLLPLSGEGNAATIAGEMRNAAILAMDAADPSALQLVIKDTSGSPDGAATAADAALTEQASAVLGPLFSANVRSVSARPGISAIPVIAFSSDRRVAGGGVYLNAFLPEGVVERTLRYAVGSGLRNVVAIVPNGAAGDLAEQAARDTLAAVGGTLLAVARYDYDNNSVFEAVRGVAEALRAADAVFIPDGGNSPATIASMITESGIDLSQKKLLGTGQWASANLSDPVLQGAWYADVDQQRLSAYKSAYRTRFGTDPSLTSALAHDSVVLAASIAQMASGIPRRAIESPVGFTGYTGLFRFRFDGTAERGYAVYEVREGAPQLIDAAPTRFGAEG